MTGNSFNSRNKKLVFNRWWWFEKRYEVLCQVYSGGNSSEGLEIPGTVRPCPRTYPKPRVRTYPEETDIMM